MKRLMFFGLVVIIIAGHGCHKANTKLPAADFSTLEQQVLNDFANNIALAQYSDLTNAAVALNAKVSLLADKTDTTNLHDAQLAWKQLREVWEQCEGFLIGPVESNDYDPNIDTWPTDYTQMDSLLASGNALALSDIQHLPQSLRGYHPVEYILFGENGSRMPSGIDERKKQYLQSLVADMLYNNIQPLYQSWASAPTNFAQQVSSAGNGSSEYATRLDFFMDIVGENGIAGICGEVGSGKMKEPFDARNPLLCESPYSGNTLSDFRNNIVGVQHVYMGMNGGKGLKDLVAAKNRSLDNQLQSQITAAINSFDNITVPYEQAIITQRVQVQQTIDQLNSLQETIENELVNFLQTNIKD